MEWLTGIGTVVGIVGGLGGLVSVYISVNEWRKTKRKIAMLTNATAAAEILPAWYTERMMQDYWLFGLITNDGQIVVIRHINSLSDDGKWIDVELATSDCALAIPPEFGRTIYAVAEDRAKASVQIRNIVAALDLQTS